MKEIYSIIALLFALNCNGQRTYTAQILSIIDSTPIPGGLARIGNKTLIEADSNGVLTFSTGKNNIRISISPTRIHRVDTLITLHSSETPIKLYSSAQIDSTLALFDIQHGSARLYCGGGIAPLAPLPGDKEFEITYSVKYLSLDCIMPSTESLVSYNKIIAEYLDKKYGGYWRKTVRPDVFYVSRPASH